MAAPAWTTREWRPLVCELCAHLLSTNVSDVTETAPAVDQKRQQKLLMRADKVVAKLYSHKYMDVTPQQIKGEVEEIAKKMEIHMFSQRANRLRKLARGCDYRVVKMLLELAETPTSVSDAHVVVHPAAPLEPLQAWNRLLTPSEDVQRAEEKARHEAALARKMEAELLQVAWDDDWWKERDADNASELEAALDDEPMSEDEEDTGATRGIASSVLNMELLNDDGDVDMYAEDKGDDGGSVTDPIDESDDEDRLLLQYFRSVPAAVDPMDTGGLDEDKTVKVSDQDAHFSLEVPSLLISHVETLTHSRLKDDAIGVHRSRELRRVVHEEVLVEAVFFALRGVPSPFFETHMAAQNCFNGELVTTDFALSTLTTRGIAVSHLSPLAMTNMGQKVVDAASNLQYLREIAAFLFRSQSDDSRSASAEGVVYRIKQQLNDCERFITDVYDKMMSAKVSYDRLDMIDSASTTKPTLPTLLGVIGAFQEMFTMLSWLKSTVMKCLEKFMNRSYRDVTAAEISSQFLTVLHQELRVEFVESSGSISGMNSQWDPYAILWHLFAGALVPYLDAMDRMVFDRSYDARIVFTPELFYVPSSRSFASPLSPRASAQRMTEETFEEAMAALISFRIESAVVPSFLLPLVRLLSAALESRQILNQYLNQHSDADDFKLKAQQLSDKFLTTLSSISTISSSSNAGISQIPIDEVIREGIIQPITEKCVRINGVVAELFHEKLQFREHMETVRMFILMHQQDVFTDLAQFIIEQIQLDPIGWAKNEPLNSALQDSIQRLYTEGLISNGQREIAARISIRVDAKELEKLRITRHIDVMAVRHLQFRFITSQPLRVLFSGSIIHKYSRLAVLLLQVKLAELILTNFKQNYRHRLCFFQTQETLRRQLVHLADMLHYTRAVLNYLANQMTGDAWRKVNDVTQQSKSIREINNAHEAYLDKMLNAFFVLKKHEGFTRQFMQNFNDIIAYGSRVDEFVRTVERNMARLFDTIEQTRPNQDSRNNSRRDIGTRRRNLVPNDEFRALYSKLQRSLQNPEGNYENQLHVITIVLDAMVKNGASPHVNELLLLLTFNSFRGPSRSSISTSRN